MASTRVYVGKLSSRTRDRDLTDRFSRYGRIVSCDLKYGYAFVEYSDARNAEDAVAALNGSLLDGCRIIVEFSKGPRQSRGDRASSRSDYRVTVDNLPRDMSWQDLKDKFRQVGDVVFADVFHDRSGRGRGIVEFRARDDMKDAIRKLNGTEVRGTPIYVREDDGRSAPRGSSRSPSRRHSSSSSRRSRSRSPRKSSPRRRHSRSRSPRRERHSRSPERRPRSRSPKRSPGQAVVGANNGGGSPKGSPRAASPTLRRSGSRSPSRSPR